MATVYLAQDLKHHRQVALKVLRPELGVSLGAGRFLHEIRIAAQLQHPHILPLLDSGESGSFLYYVMPYVEGESLRERLARRGELPISEAVRILSEVADALAYAHGRGLVHRDMKPENIMLSGRHPLVMDFGIAKALSNLTAGWQVTTEGVALGTPAYMAPEQAAADPHLDQRVDIYALGVIGYELLAGTTPFTGSSAQQVLAAHMTQKPEPISTRRPAVPGTLAATIMACLEKRPADRPQSAEDVLEALEALVTPSSGLTPTGSAPLALTRKSKTSRSIAGLVVLLVIMAAGVTLFRGRATPARARVARHTQLTFVGNVSHPEISPDGQLLAYVEESDSSRLVVRDLAGGSTLPITTLGDWTGLRWSPDGASILRLGRFHDKWSAVLIPRLGGPARPLTTSGAFGVLSPDGSQLATWYENFEGSTWVTTLGTSETREFKTPKEVGFREEGDWSPDGRFLAVLSVSATGNRWMLWTGEIRTGRWQEILADTMELSPPRWSASGDGLYYVREHELRKVPVGRDGLVRGPPETLQTGLEATNLSLTRDGKKLAYLRRQPRSNLWLASRRRSGGPFTKLQLTRGTTEKSDGRLSPDGRLVAYIERQQGRGDVFVVPIESGEPRRITSSGVADATPAWSPDGHRLAYIAALGVSRRVRTVTLEGDEEHTYQKTDASDHLVWAPYDRILFQRPLNRNFYWLDLKTEAEEPLVRNDSIGWILGVSPSSDRRHLALFWNRPPRFTTYLVSLGDTAQTPVGPEGLNRPWGWSQDGSSLFLEDEAHRILRVSLRSRTVTVHDRQPIRQSLL